MAWLWTRFGHRVNLGGSLGHSRSCWSRRAALIYGVHELTEANIFPNSQPWHDATEPYGPDGIYCQYHVLLVVLPLGWLAVSNFLGRSNNASQRSQTA